MTNIFRPVNATKKLTSEQVENSKVFMEEVHTLANLDIHQCLNFDNFIFVKYDGRIKADTNIIIKNPRQFKDTSKEFSKPLQPTIRNIKVSVNSRPPSINLSSMA